MITKQNNTRLTDADFDAILDVTTEARVSDRDQFANLMRRREEQRAEVLRTLRQRDAAAREMRCTARVLRAIAR